MTMINRHKTEMQTTVAKCYPTTTLSILKTFNNFLRTLNEMATVTASHVMNYKCSESADFRRKPESSESGFRTSDFWIRTVIRIVTKTELIGPWAMPYLSKKFRQNLFTTFSVIRRTADKQTDRAKNITSFGRGNFYNCKL